jgi:hypothetical protein
MKTRKLLDGSEVKELDEPKTLTVFTRCPSKYKLVDMETGQEYIGYETEGKNCWERIEKKE